MRELFAHSSHVIPSFLVADIRSSRLIADHFQIICRLFMVNVLIPVDAHILPYPSHIFASI